MTTYNSFFKHITIAAKTVDAISSNCAITRQAFGSSLKLCEPHKQVLADAICTLLTLDLSCITGGMKYVLNCRALIQRINNCQTHHAPEDALPSYRAEIRTVCYCFKGRSCR
jgi:hypothetical protein